MLQNYRIKKTSSVETYWHQLSQLYVKWKGRRMEPLLLKQTYVVRASHSVPDSRSRVQFINGPLTKEHDLEVTETDKPVLEAEDLLEVLRYHWVTDTNIFPNERQRVQLATLLLLAAYTGSRPGALLAITYEDVRLFVLRDPKTGKLVRMMQICLRKTKSRVKQRRP